MAVQVQRLSLDKFKKCFAHSCRYGENDPWPNETILFYRLIGEDKLTSWKKISTFSKEPGHVEIRMMQDEELIPSQLPGTTYTLEMVISYSPCRGCSDALIKFKSKFKSLQKDLRITIRIGSFYRISNPWDTYNMDGLLNLIKKNVVLKSFDGDSDWTEFLRDIVNLQENQLSVWLGITGKLARREREYVDRCILKDIYGCCHGAVSKHELCKMGAVASPMQAMENYGKRSFIFFSFIWQLRLQWQVSFPWTS